MIRRYIHRPLEFPSVYLYKRDNIYSNLISPMNFVREHQIVDVLTTYVLSVIEDGTFANNSYNRMGAVYSG